MASWLAGPLEGQKGYPNHQNHKETIRFIDIWARLGSIFGHRGKCIPHLLGWAAGSGGQLGAGWGARIGPKSKETITFKGIWAHFGGSFLLGLDFFDHPILGGGSPSNLVEDQKNPQIN